MPHNLKVVSYPFSPNTLAVNSFFPFSSLFLPKFSFIPVSNPSFFELQPTIQEHEELVWLARNLKLEVTNYSRELYSPRGVAHLGSGDDDDDDDDEKDSEETPSYCLRKRRHQ